jgi:NitT/TauT family transport system substrate-binding protein
MLPDGWLMAMSKVRLINCRNLSPCKTAAILFGLLLLTATPNFVRSAEAQTKITVTQSSASMAFAVLYVAQSFGYFRDEGLEVELLPAGGGPKALAAVIGGGAQFAAGVLSDAIVAHRRGLNDLREIAVLLNGYSMPLLLRKDVAEKHNITSQSSLDERVASLKGMRVAITTPGSGSDLLVRYLAKSHGMDPDRDLEIIPVGGIENLRAAMEAGRVDACTCLPPVDITLIKNSAAILLLDPTQEIPILRNVHFVTLHVSKAYAESHRSITIGFVRAVSRGIQKIVTDNIAAREATRQFFPSYERKVFDAAWEEIRPLVPATAEVTDDGVQKEVAFENALLPLDKKFTISDLVDNSWVHLAAQGTGK